MPKLKQSILQKIVQNKRLEVQIMLTEKQAGRVNMPDEAPRFKAQDFYKLPNQAPFLFAEIKPKSPSSGTLYNQEQLNFEAILNQFQTVGAKGISVLTDKKYFGGSYENLKKVATLSNLPILCKDFILNSIQIEQAKISGASLILLIVKILDFETLLTLTLKALELGLIPFIEVNNKVEIASLIELTKKLGVTKSCNIIVAVNNRNLETLELDLNNSKILIDLLPKNCPKFALSGLKSTSDIELMSKIGYDGVLVGTEIANNPQNFLLDIVSDSNYKVEIIAFPNRSNPELKLIPPLNLLELFEILVENQGFLFESLSEPINYDSRYSILGFSPVLKYTCHKGKEQITKYPNLNLSTPKQLVLNKTVIEAGNKLGNPTKTMAQINNLFKTDNIFCADSSVNINNFPFIGGLVGNFNYEAVNYLEQSKIKLAESLEFETINLNLYLDGLVLDKFTGKCFYFFNSAIDSNLEKIQQIQIENEQKVKNVLRNEPKVKILAQSTSIGNYQKGFQEIKEAINAGRTFQCQYGFRQNYEITGNTLEIYKHLKEVNPSPFMFYIRDNEKIILGASPELIFRLQDDLMENYPLAGTIGRGEDEEADSELTNKLLSDQKEIAEHRMLVDLHRNDLGKVAKIGTVKIRKLMDIVKFSHVQHISSEIMGILDTDKYNMFEAFGANFPAGTLTGTPKTESINIIQNLEKLPRGPYGGAVGYFGMNNNCQFCIAIRSLFICQNRAFAQASSGIVLDSVMEDEYQEIQNKLAGMNQTLKKFLINSN